MDKQDTNTPKVKKPIYKRVWFWVVAFLIIGVVGSAAFGDKKDTASAPEKTEDVKKSTSEKETSKSTEKQPVKPVEKKEPEVPIEYKSALTKAEQYAKTMAMSKQGIYDQLVSEYGEKFSPEAAKYAIDNVKADWNANALKKAETYQKEMAMSPESIRDQLVSEYGEKFTAEEAQYAINNLPK